MFIKLGEFEYIYEIKVQCIMHYFYCYIKADRSENTCFIVSCIGANVNSKTKNVKAFYGDNKHL